jgi:hypothetical protein
MTHRSEISELNKLAADIAIREQTDSNPSVVDLLNIPDLPVGLVNGHVLRRRRGTKSDERCVAEICELIANGVAVKTARAYVGVAAGTWMRWRTENNCDLIVRLQEAQRVKMDDLADDAMEIFDQLKTDRESALEVYRKAYDAYYSLPPNDPDRPKFEPTYKGPSDLDVRIAEARVKHRQWQLERRHPDFAQKSEIKSVNRTIISKDAITIDMTPQEAMRKYEELISRVDDEE